LLCHYEFAAREVLARLRQQDGELKRKNMRTVKVLMQAIVIIGAILEQKRCGPRLACSMAALNEVGVVRRVLNIDAPRRISAIGDRGKMWKKLGPQKLGGGKEGGGEKFVFAAPQAMKGPENKAAEKVVLRVEAGYLPAFVWSKKTLDEGAALGVEIVRHAFPIERLHPLHDAFGRNSVHAPASRSRRDRLRSTLQR